MPLIRASPLLFGLPGWILGVAFLVATAGAEAETWRLQPSISLQETLTNNVNLQPSEQRQGDLVTLLTPSLTITETGAHSSVSGSVAVPVALYARTAAENNQTYGQASLTGNAELVERFLYLDGAVNISQQFLTPFGAQPDNLSNATNNRYTTQIYRISPYIKGTSPGNISYELRDDNIWNNLNGVPTTLNETPFNANNSYTNQLVGTFRREPTPSGWQVDYNRSDVRFEQQGPQLQELGRLRLLHDPDPELELGASMGYERNEFQLSSYRGAIYGAGLKWHPNERTSVDGFWEHRYFGGSYGLDAGYRTPLTVWRLQASRNVTSYPQQLAALPAGGNVPLLLNELFSSRVTNPLERQNLVDQLIRDRGLPTTLLSPVNLYTQQLTLQDSASATFGMLGARNSVFFTAFYLRSEPISGAGNPLPPELAGLNSNTQTGGSVVWTSQLTPLVTFATSFSLSRTVADAPFSATSRTGSINAQLSAPLSSQTTVYAGARYQVQTSDVSSDFNEAAAFLGITYTFR